MQNTVSIKAPDGFDWNTLINDLPYLIMDKADVLEITEYCKVNQEIQETSVEDSHSSLHSQEKRLGLTRGRKIILVPITHSHTKPRHTTSMMMTSQQAERSRGSKKENKLSIPVTIVVEAIESSETQSEDTTELTDISPPPGINNDMDTLQLVQQRGENSSNKRHSPLNFKYCYTCEAPIKPFVERRIGPTNWALSTLVCSLGCFLGCCLIPFFTEAAKDKVEVCSLCKNDFS